MGRNRHNEAVEKQPNRSKADDVVIKGRQARERRGEEGKRGIVYIQPFVVVVPQRDARRATHDANRIE